jgi:hypothetical protein
MHQFQFQAIQRQTVVTLHYQVNGVAKPGCLQAVCHDIGTVGLLYQGGTPGVVNVVVAEDNIGWAESQVLDIFQVSRHQVRVIQPGIKYGWCLARYQVYVGARQTGKDYPACGQQMY